ncbi:MFS general substrate transporter [Daldinia loculata]|nr:MFS general substrate transporter [Daldinia loculata]
MTSADITNDHDESRHVDESSPLLQNGVEVAGDVPVPSEPPHSVPIRHKQRIIILLCAFAFTMMLGDNLQPAALVQVFENVICDDYYKTNSLPPASNGTLPNPCKAQPIQKELALVRGFQQLVPIFPSLLCTVPYGLLAERIGRKRVLIMSGAGVFSALSWVLAVCYWRFASIRWALLSGAFLFLGGGDAVISTILHVMVTDTADDAERAQIFLYLHAADVISGFFGPAISGPLMEKGHTWVVLLLAAGTLFSGAFLLTIFIPETLNLRKRSTEHSALLSDSTSPQSTDSLRSESPTPTKVSNSIIGEASNILSPLLSVLASNRQALLLLLIFSPQTGARELFTLIGLQYTNAKFSLSYARGNVLLSIFQGAQGLFVLTILPLITRLIADKRGWSAWARDRLYAIVSIAATALGLMVIGVAPALVVEALGLLFVAVGSCSTGLLMSLLGGAVRPSQVSAVYSAAHMLSIVVRSVIGPVLSALLVTGLELGWSWMGLPFVTMALLMAGAAVASSFIRAERVIDFDEE